MQSTNDRLHSEDIICTNVDTIIYHIDDLAKMNMIIARRSTTIIILLGRSILPSASSLIQHNDMGARLMGGGPRNPEHKRSGKMRYRKEQINKVIKQNKNTIKELESRAKVKKANGNGNKDASTKVTTKPNDIEEVPTNIQRYIPSIEEYITNEWLPQYPSGVKLRRLRSDIAFRMKKPYKGPSRKEKLPMNVIKAIAWEVVSRGNTLLLKCGCVKLVYTN